MWAERYVPSGGSGYRFTPNVKTTQEPAFEGPGAGASAAPVLKDWVECIKSRKRTIANEEVAYYSTMACFMAAEAYKTKARVEWKREWDLPV